MSAAVSTARAREKGIIFTAESVRAILEGRKTVTRRLVKPQPGPHHVLSPCWGTSPDGVAFGKPHVWVENGPDYPDGPDDERRCPYGVPGDRLWVRETLRVSEQGWVYAADESKVDIDPDDSDRYEAALTWAGERPAETCPPIFMPRWASRLALEVVDVRVEQLHDITEEDAKAEGVTLGKQIPALVNGEPGIVCFFNARDAFAYGWNAINGKRSPWLANAWVWVISFRRLP